MKTMRQLRFQIQDKQCELAAKLEIKFKGTVSCSVRDVYATVAVEVATLPNQNWVSLKAPESTVGCNNQLYSRLLRFCTVIKGAVSRLSNSFC